jgi:hypothetical protein
MGNARGEVDAPGGIEPKTIRDEPAMNGGAVKPSAPARAAHDSDTSTVDRNAGPDQSPASMASPPDRRARRARVEEFVIERPQTAAPASKPGALRGTESASRPRVSSRETERGKEGSVEREGDQLFQPTDAIDLSPSAWAARLVRSPQAPRESVRAGAVSPPRTTPGVPSRGVRVTRTTRETSRPDVRVQLSEQTRRFVKPLAGIDPTTVDIWQGPLSTAVTRAERSEAVAIGGDAILVGPTFDDRSTRGASLVAHELTHIARYRQPRFIPPVLSPLAGRASAPRDEESMARAVEARVLALADHSLAPGLPPFRGIPAARFPSDLPTESQTATTVGPPAPRHDEWGDLPAPWEPLPPWITSPPRPASSSTLLAPASNATPSAPLFIPAAAPVAGAAVTVQRAEVGRVLEPAGESAAPAAPAATPPAPDLDVLARQVYAVLKRRLESEMRRELTS